MNSERREPATEAGRQAEAKLLSLLSWLTNGSKGEHERVNVRDLILAIEAQATEARVAALVEAARDFDTVADQWCSDDDTGSDAREQARLHLRAILSDLPAAAAECSLDVERLARACRAANMYKPEEWAAAIAAEYARLSAQAPVEDAWTDAARQMLGASERREPATEAGRELAAELTRWWSDTEFLGYALDHILAIESQAAAGREADALREALQAVVDHARPFDETGHSLTDKCWPSAHAALRAALSATEPAKPPPSDPDLLRPLTDEAP